MTCITCGTTMTHLKADLFTCESCGLVSSDILPDLSIYDKSYDIKYQRYTRTETSKLLQKIRFSTVVAWMRDSDFYPKILDFGCGTGDFVKCLDNSGINSFNINPNGIIINGFDINPYGKYCDVTVFLNGFNVVTFWDSLEHVQNPKKLIEGLKADYLFISTPSLDDYRGDLLEFHHYYPGEHVHYFSAKSLSRLVKLCGYEEIVRHYKESEIRTSGGDKNILTMGFERGSN